MNKVAISKQYVRFPSLFYLLIWTGPFPYIPNNSGIIELYGEYKRNLIKSCVYNINSKVICTLIKALYLTSIWTLFSYVLINLIKGIINFRFSSSNLSLTFSRWSVLIVNKDTNKFIIRIYKMLSRKRAVPYFSDVTLQGSSKSQFCFPNQFTVFLGTEGELYYLLFVDGLVR